ncbi:hypothetical protein AWC38_SpisGene12936 [Stylophora pistillata]|uniref:EGF-like domain-containing protein n=1 Tax=Stylophora pistillata TaxID=50429 RepID=A0A2B4S1U2_STYPI|nr:hypothetical protein AWC38_SpisGene12936 [Stylophora pistillata]
MVNHVIRVKDVKNKESCEIQCFLEPNCVSYNLERILTEIDGIHKCELNDVTHEGNNDDLVEDENYYYRGAENVCLTNPYKNNATCHSGNTGGGNCCLCTAGFKGQICEEVAVSSCKEAYEKKLINSSGGATILMDSIETSVFCHAGDFGRGDGFWTPVLKINGNKRTFHYDSKFWMNKKEYNLPRGLTGIDQEETKLLTYWNTSFSKICLGMKINQQLRIGFGTGGPHDDNNTCGIDTSMALLDNGERHIKGMGYIFVQ